MPSPPHPTPLLLWFGDRNDLEFPGCYNLMTNLRLSFILIENIENHNQHQWENINNIALAQGPDLNEFINKLN